MSDEQLTMLNVFEILDETGAGRKLLCYVDGPRAGSVGIDPRSIVGEIPHDTLAPADTFNPETFRLNPGFIESIIGFMNEVGSAVPDVIEQAKSVSTGWLYIIDGRHKDRGAEPEPENVVGAFAVDETGQIVPNTFVYNEKHKLFHENEGISGMLSNPDFFRWLNPNPPAAS